MNNSLSITNIKNNLNPTLSFVDIDILDSIDSTNDYLKKLALNNAPHGKIIIANHQTKGKGTNNRSFYSPAGTGIYMSILIRPDFSPTSATLLTPATAVCVAEAIETISNKKTDIKWVNDIYINNLKVCGILTETSCTNANHINYAIIGIGINVYCPDNYFPSDISHIAGYIMDTKESTHNNNLTNNIKNPEVYSNLINNNANSDIRNNLCALIINNFFKLYNNLLDKTFFNDYKKRLFTLNKPLIISETNEEVTAIDIDQDFRLKIRYKNGREKFISNPSFFSQ